MKANNPRISDYEDYIRAMAVEIGYIDSVLDLPFEKLRAYVEEEIEFGGNSHDDDGCNETEDKFIGFSEEKYLEQTQEAAGYPVENNLGWWE